MISVVATRTAGVATRTERLEVAAVSAAVAPEAVAAAAAIVEAFLVHS